MQIKTRSVSDKSTSAKSNRRPLSQAKQRRYTVSFDLSEDAYGLALVSAKMDGHSDVGEAAREALQRDVAALFEGMSEDEYKELFGIKVA